MIPQVDLATGALIFAQRPQPVGGGGSSMPAKLVADDIEITAVGKGVIIPSPNGTRWRLTPSDAGQSVWTQL